jgi:alpha-tubulin suppressor-like RCC1 family protein
VALKSVTGAIDIASIMVGVIVIGSLTGIIAATLFAVIPWAEVKAAEGDLAAIRTAESVAFVQTGSYMTVSELVEAGYLQEPRTTTADGLTVSTVATTVEELPKVLDSVSVVVGDGGACYVAGAVVASGDIFYALSGAAGVNKYVDDVTKTDECASVAPLVAALRGIVTIPVIVGGVLDAVNAGLRFSYAITTDVGVDSYGITSGSLPAGLTLNTRTGLISGTPTTTEDYVFGVTAVLGRGISKEAIFTGTILMALPTLTTTSLPQATVKQAYAASITASGTVSRYTIVSGTLPAGLTFNTSTGLISGTPTAYGDVSLGFTASNSGGDTAVLVLAMTVVPAPAAAFVTVSAGGYHATALDSHGDLWGWGRNTNGELGMGYATGAPAPVRMSTTGVFKIIANGSAHSVAVDRTGRIYSWGSDQFGQQGNTDSNKNNITQITQMTWGYGMKVSAVSAGDSHTLAVTDDGALWSWGSDSDGQVGNGSTYTHNITDPQKIPTSGVFTSVASGKLHSVALDRDGYLWSWGSDVYGQQGNGAKTGNIHEPTRMSTSARFISVEAGAHTTIAIDTEGHLWSWGWGGNALLGNGGLSDVTAPEKLVTATTFTSVTSGATSSLAVGTDGSLWSWGRNNAGQQGNGSATGDVLVPTQVKSTVKFDTVSAGIGFVVAIAGNGRLWTWGDDFGEALGNGSASGVVNVPTMLIVEAP